MEPDNATGPISTTRKILPPTTRVALYLGPTKKSSRFNGYYVETKDWNAELFYTI